MVKHIDTNMYTMILNDHGISDNVYFILILGVSGRWLLMTSKDSGGVTNDAQKCLDWYANEQRSIYKILMISAFTPQCPCDLFGMRLERRFRFDWATSRSTGFSKYCFYSRLPTTRASKVSATSSIDLCFHVPCHYLWYFPGVCFYC